MAVYKDKNGTWYVSARYTNWKGEADRKVKRGFQTKREAAEGEKNFFLENAGNLDMTFEAFYQLYKQNTKDRIKLNTWKMKESVIEGKILPYFRSRRMNEIKPRDVVNWQNTMMKMTDENGKPFSPVYLKTIHNQLSAIFNHAVKFYDLPSNPAQKAGNMGKEKSREMLFWTQAEYQQFAEEMISAQFILLLTCSSNAKKLPTLNCSKLRSPWHHILKPSPAIIVPAHPLISRTPAAVV